MSPIFNSIHLEKATISKKVVDHVKNLIINRKLKSGEKLPPEREMAHMLNVSRNTIRESYKILTALGYVQTKHGQGVFVSDGKTILEQFASTFFIENDQLRELFAIRKLLETQSVGWAAEKATEEQIKELQNIMEHAYSLAEEDNNCLTVAKADQEFHLLLAEMSGNSILIRIMFNLTDLLAESRRETMEIPGRVFDSLKEHTEIVKAVSDRNADQAKEQMLIHLNSVESALFRKKEHSKNQ